MLGQDLRVKMVWLVSPQISIIIIIRNTRLIFCQKNSGNVDSWRWKWGFLSAGRSLSWEVIITPTCRAISPTMLPHLVVPNLIFVLVFGRPFPAPLTFLSCHCRGTWMRRSEIRSATCRSWRSTRRRRLTNISPERFRRSRRARGTGEVRTSEN